MELIAITDLNEIRKAKQILETSLKSKSLSYYRPIGWRGGYRDIDVFWRPQNGFWTSISSAGNRYWFGYGIEPPEQHRSLSITCEINIPMQGEDRRTAGVFANDTANHIYIAHSGKVGGGKKGIGKTEFLKHYRGESLQSIAYADGQTREMIVLGRIDRSSIYAQIEHFIKEVHRFKFGGTFSANNLIEVAKASSEHSYTPEFSGERTAYPLGNKVEAKCYHGVVVGALADLLERHGISIANDKRRDLYTYGPSREITCVFEVKTDLTTPSIYSSIGQLKFNSSQLPECSALVALFPGKPTRETTQTFEKLGISLLTYRRVGQKVRFEDPQGIIRLANKQD